MILVAYRHGLRASEACDLQWHQVELDQGRMHVRRAKNGTPSVHPIRGDEICALRKLRRESPTEAYLFVTERGGAMSTIGFHHLIQRLGKAARMPFSLHPHMLRHAWRDVRYSPDFRGDYVKAEDTGRRLIFTQLCTMIGLPTFPIIATRRSPGTRSRSKSSRSPARSVANTDSPVTLPPGRARLSTSPLPTGSPAAEKTIGIVAVACFEATISGVPEVTIISTLRRANSAAISAARSLRPSVQRYSIAIVRPSIQESSCNRPTKAVTRLARPQPCPGPYIR